MTPDEMQGLAQSLSAAKDYADAIVKEPLEQVGGLLADTVGYWRLKNRVRLFLKAKQFMEEAGVKPNTKLLPSVFVPLVEEAGNTDDPDLSDMFARLLASHLDPASQSKVHPAFAKVLGQLSPLDAAILKLIDDRQRKLVESDYSIPREKMNPVRIGKAIGKSGLDIQTNLNNLDRLGLCTSITPTFADEEATGRLNTWWQLVEIADWRLTNFGRSLLSACSPPGTYWHDKEHRKLVEALEWAEKKKAEKPAASEQRGYTSNKPF